MADRMRVTPLMAQGSETGGAGFSVPKAEFTTYPLLRQRESPRQHPAQPEPADACSDMTTSPLRVRSAESGVGHHLSAQTVRRGGAGPAGGLPGGKDPTSRFVLTWQGSL